MVDSPFLDYGGVRLLNVPSARPVAEEIFVEDCYRLDSIPLDYLVIDVGAFYGEFALACAQRGCRVVAVEPSPVNYEILWLNKMLNQQFTQGMSVKHRAVHDRSGIIEFHHRPDHPAGSCMAHCLPDGVTGTISKFVDCVTIEDLIDSGMAMWGMRRVCVKLDCEGAERAIFDGPAKWLDAVSLLVMEWHNHDGHVYRDILTDRGFKVELEGGGPKPRPAWDHTISGGLLFASRS